MTADGRNRGGNCHRTNTATAIEGICRNGLDRIADMEGLDMDVAVEDRSRSAAHIGATVGIEVHCGKAGASGKSPVTDIGHRTRDSKRGEVAPAREGMVAYSGDGAGYGH